MSAATDPPSTSSAASPPPAAPEAKPAVRRRGERRGLYTIIGVVAVVVVLVGVGAATNWYGLQTSSTKGCSSNVTLQGNGAQIANPLLTVWAGTYNGQTHNSINYVDGGSGTGLTDFSEHPPLIDFAIADEPLTPGQVSNMPAGAEPLTLPFVGGALTIIYNVPGLTGTTHLNLTGAVLEEIYNGTVTTWNATAIADINPGVHLPDLTIVPVVRSDPAGTTYVLSDFLSQASTWWATNVGKGISIDWPHVAAETGAHGNSAVISTVAKTPAAGTGTIGYSDLTDVLTYSSPLNYAAVQNPKGYNIVPTIADTASAIADKVATLASIPASSDWSGWFNVSMVNAPGDSDYPLATFLYMYVYQKADLGYTPTLAKSQVIVQWLDYVLSPAAQALVNETSPSQLYYTALPAAVISVDQAGISTMTFNGAAIPACK